jgi:DNA-binding MarR family transcriptional regulator
MARSRGTVAIEDLLDYKIGQLRKLLDRYSSPMIVEQFGLSLAEWRVLSHIHSGSSVTAFWLCRRLQADRAEVSRACAALIRRRYVASRRNPADARSALLELTSAGRTMYRRIMPARQQLQNELIDALDAPEIAVLYRALDKLTKAISDKIAPTASTAPTASIPSTKSIKSTMSTKATMSTKTTMSTKKAVRAAATR